METEVKKPSIIGKISTFCGLAALFIGIAGISAAFILQLEFLLLFSIVFSALSVIVGIISGIIGLFSNRAWVGLSLNALILVFSIAVLLILPYFFYCCTPTPPYR